MKERDDYHPFHNHIMKKILIINSGSSSIKYQLIEMPTEMILVKGIVDGIGTSHSFFSMQANALDIKESMMIMNHESGLKYIIESLLKHQIILDFSQVDGCGHRVAHGGEIFHHSVLINQDVEMEIDRLGILAPMHNPMNLLGYQILKTLLPNAIHAAVFDTSFHQTISSDSFLYPIPYEYYQNDGIRKYGFHGTSCHYVALKVKEVLGSSASQKMIVCHLGNGASLTAIKDGKSVDTSMGLTPLGGISMGTRSGNIDPSIVEYISCIKGISVTEVLSILNYKSGLLGVSGSSHDMRVLCDNMKQGDKQSQLAIEVYVKRIVDYIGAYYLHLGGLDTLVFTAGIGENSSIIRDMIVERIQDALAMSLNKKKNEKIESDVQIISSQESKVTVCVIKTDEEKMIAKETYALMTTR